MDYEGSYDEYGNYHGRGKLSSGFFYYTGQFEHGFMHGRGGLTNEDDTLIATICHVQAITLIAPPVQKILMISYIGMFVYGQYDGYGKLKANDGQYEGEWKNGVPNGKGVISNHAERKVYDGQFCDGYASGFGRIYNQSHEDLIYEGFFKNGECDGRAKEGIGLYDMYEWKNGKKHGYFSDYTGLGFYENNKIFGYGYGYNQRRYNVHTKSIMIVERNEVICELIDNNEEYHLQWFELNNTTKYTKHVFPDGSVYFYVNRSSMEYIGKYAVDGNINVRNRYI